ncbi:hypothetical protein C2S53_001765, partial [Perilla frutescens var. hirtella]
AFESTWAAACQNDVSHSVKISLSHGKTFLISPIEFEGPCKCDNITFEILGSIVAQPKSAWQNTNKGAWLKFQGVDHLSIVGNDLGLVDGQGDSWWNLAMLFANCNNLEIMGLRHVNSQKFHVSISNSSNATLSKLHMIAPSNSPNTDGIDIGSSTNITIQNCTMETGDDCIAIKGGTSNVQISEIACGPGHGISIGSLGEDGKHDQVEAININNCTFNGTQNGVRIKTWQGGSGFARNINFSNIIFTMSDNPVIIDQFYCPHKICSNETSAVKVSDVRYSGLTGTSSESKHPAISFRCSETVPCNNIVVDGVDIKSSDQTKSPYSVCLNAHGIARNATSPPLDCLKI